MAWVKSWHTPLPASHASPAVVETVGRRLTRWLPRGRLLWLSPLMVALAATALTFVFRHPLMPVYLAILHKVIAR